MLAELGYVAFAADMYGKGVRPTEFEVLSPCRGQRPHHVQRDRIGTWEVSGLAVSVV
jgi:dienelactone hydrolase